jgi:hypothetical protein
MSFVIQTKTGISRLPVLKRILASFVSVCIVTLALRAAVDSPGVSQQQRMLDKVKQCAGRYLENLPNFVCFLVTEQYEAGKKPKHWTQRDTVTERLIFNRGKEDRILEMVNGKAVSKGRFVTRPLQTEGEFGGLVSKVLNANSSAQISWIRWEELRGRRLAVFEYLIDHAHSQLNLSLGGQGALVPYRGLIYADPETGELWRITQVPFDLPDFVETKSIETTIDYDQVDISNRHFVLPASASIRLDTGERNIWNKVAFTAYRKFEAESKITFVSGSN